MLLVKYFQGSPDLPSECSSFGVISGGSFSGAPLQKKRKTVRWFQDLTSQPDLRSRLS